MKVVITSVLLLGAGGVGLVAYSNNERAVAPAAESQVRESDDADRLYELVGRARAELRAMRVKAGLGATTAAPEADRGESHGGREGAGEHGRAEGRGEDRARVGREHGGSGREGREGREGEEESAYLPKMTRQDKLFANGARLVLQFNPRTQVFAGSVTNTTARPLTQVRVEVHLDNGTELGPTKRVDIAPGRTIPVELGAFGGAFNSWVSHPEAGVEQGRGAGGEGGGEAGGEHSGREGRGEHGGGEGEGARPLAAAYRPVYNQLQILRGELRAFDLDLKSRSR